MYNSCATVDNFNIELDPENDITYLSQPRSSLSVTAEPIDVNTISANTSIIPIKILSSNENIIIINKIIQNADPITNIIHSDSKNRIYNMTDATYNPAYIITKYDPSGIISWIVTISGVALSDIIDMAIDNMQNIILAGSYSSKIELRDRNNCIIGKIIPDCDSRICSYLIKLNFDGNITWIATINSTSVSRIKSIGVDNLDNIFICGQYNGGSINNIPAILFDSSNRMSNIILGQSIGYSGFMAKYNKAGVPQWAIQITSPPSLKSFNTSLNCISVYDDSIYLSGQFQSQSIILSSSSNSTLNQVVINYPTDYYDPDNLSYCNFIARYSTDGFIQWGSSIYGINHNTLMITGYINGVIVCGNLSHLIICHQKYIFATTDLINSTTDTIKLPQHMHIDSKNSPTILMKINKNGLYKWNTYITGTKLYENNNNNQISFYSHDRFVLTGSYKTKVSFYSNTKKNDRILFRGSLGTGMFRGADFIVAYTNKGQVLWYSKNITGFAKQIPRITSKKTSALFLTGSYKINPLQIYNSNGALVITLPAVGLYDKSYAVSYRLVSQYIKLSNRSLSNIPRMIVLNNQVEEMATILITSNMLVNVNRNPINKIIFERAGSSIKIIQIIDKWILIGGHDISIIYS